MTDSLAALLAGAIDYAGMYPPASLSLEQSVENYRRYRASPEAWMLGRFVCPAARLADLAAMGWTEHDGLLAMIAPAGETAPLLLKNLDDALGPVRKSPVVHAIDTLEIRWPAEVSCDPNIWQDLTEVVGKAGIVDLPAYQRVIRTSRPFLTIFCEFAPVNASFPDIEWRKALSECVKTVADGDEARKGSPYRVGFKFRTGGTEANAVPTSAALSLVICTCRDREMFWKATAGLHRAYRHFDAALGSTVHGFVNVLTAAVLAAQYDLDERTTQDVLDDADAAHFSIAGGSITWRDYSITAEQIAAVRSPRATRYFPGLGYSITAKQIAEARHRSLRSFGSCSFDEPCEDLVTLCKKNRV